VDEDLSTRTPAAVLLHIWGIPTHAIPRAFAHVLADPRAMAREPGVQFVKILGTARAETFGLADTDLRHWVMVTTWSDASVAAHVETTSRTLRSWDALADERFRVSLRPLHSMGRWSGHAPFGAMSDTTNEAATSPLAILTRARVRTSQWAKFAGAATPVARQLAAHDAPTLALGIGESPIGLQGTFSIWRDYAHASAFAHSPGAHRDVISRTHMTGWYSEELYARFAVESIEGTYRGQRVEL
jgi:hypothetical protein